MSAVAVTDESLPGEVAGDPPRPSALGRRTCDAGDVISHDDVRRISLALPGAYERASFGGRPSWRTKARMFTWLREGPEALVVWVESVDDRDSLMASDPAKFFITAHYEGYAMVLVRLGALDPTEANELITESWRLRAPRSLVRAWDADHG